MRQIRTLLSLSLVVSAHAAFAHTGDHHGQAAAQFAWSFDWPVIVMLVLAAGGYLLGWCRVRREGNAARVLGSFRPLAFAGGMAALVVALLSPLDSLAGQLFAVHMTQHLLLMLVAPPLLVWGRPVLVWLWAFPLAQRRRIGRTWVATRALHATHAFVMHPLVVWLAASSALWFWHIPGPYDWALASEPVHVLEHLCFLMTSLAFWTLMMEPYGPRRITHGTALIMVATLAIHNGLLGALLTFAPAPLYRAYQVPAYGLTPLEDQQLAGLIMWVPAGLVYLAALAALFVGLLSQVKPYRGTVGLQKL